ncbi:MAG: hypothetical protein IJB57_10915 [Clostridia bacterium]|nr:hypothetical protein [Clostridia bacterium]
MARYIDADVLVAEINRIISELDVDAHIALSLAAGNFIDIRDNVIPDVPTADVAKVKHGEWIDRYKNKHANHLYECSICSGTALYELHSNELVQTKARQALTAVCPHCGAKMDGKPREGGAE